MIEVVSYVNGRSYDRAEADSPESALIAARTLWDEMPRLQGIHKDAVVRFFVDGEMVREARHRDLFTGIK